MWQNWAVAEYKEARLKSFFRAVAGLCCLFAWSTVVAQHPAVCRVRVPTGGGSWSLGTGTLIAVNDDWQGKQVGYVLTAAHVVSGVVGQPICRFPEDATAAEDKGSVVLKATREPDLAILRIWKPKTATPVPLASALDARSEFVVAGYGGGSYAESRGRFGRLWSRGMYFGVLTTVRQGDSGGPIFTTDGHYAGCLWGCSNPGAARGETLGSTIETISEWLPKECQVCLPGGS